MLLRQVTVQYLIPVSYYLLFPEILPDSQRLNPVLLRLSHHQSQLTDSVATSSAKTVAAGTATVMHAAINSPAKRLMFSSSKLSVLFLCCFVLSTFTVLVYTKAQNVFCQ